MSHLDIELTMIPQLGVKGVARLMEIFGTAEAIFSASREEIIQRTGMTKTAIADAIVKRVSAKLAEAEVKYCQKHGLEVLVNGSENYPALLSQAADAPHVIYYKGDSSIYNQRAVTVVGTRSMTPYGERAITHILDELAQRVPNLVINSGLSYGVDGAAHRAALSLGVPTAAVLPTTLPSVTPSAHTNLARDIVEQGGALLSELNSTSRVNGNQFAARNRILAAMSSVTVVVESAAGGGSLSTAKAARDDYNREVLALPGRVTDAQSTGCNMLIRDNIASPLIFAEDIIRAAMWDLSEDIAPRADLSVAEDSLTDAQRGLLGCFRGDEPLHIDQLIRLTGLGQGDLMQILLELEMENLIKFKPGNMYVPFMKRLR